MHRISILFAVAFIIAVPAIAQTARQRPLVYINFNAGFGPLYGGGISMEAIIRRHHEVSAGLKGFQQQGRNFPEDWLCGSCKDTRPDRNVIYGAELTYGYVLYPRLRPDRLRFVLRAGMLLGEQNISRNFQPVANPAHDDDNYTFNEDRHFTAALLLRPTLDITPGRVAGLSLGPYAIFSPDFNSGGFTLGILLGHVGTRSMRPKAQRTRQTAGKHPADRK